MCAYNKHTLGTVVSLLDVHGLNKSRHLAWIHNDTQDYKHGRMFLKNLISVECQTCFFIRLADIFPLSTIFRWLNRIK